MKVLANGYFSLPLDGPTLAKGLRDSTSIGRNSGRLIQGVRAIGKDETLQALPSVSLHDIMNDALVIKNDFPFPQIFPLDKYLIICNKTTILEYANSVLSLKFTTVAGELWSVVGVGDFVYLSNGIVSVVRDPRNGVYATSSIGPICSSICNYNGQIICGNIR